MPVFALRNKYSKNNLSRPAYAYHVAEPPNKQVNYPKKDKTSYKILHHTFEAGKALESQRLLNEVK